MDINSDNISEPTYCFCTLALNEEYRICAMNLARDLQQYCPKIPFIIFTDEPGSFTKYPNVKVFKYKQQSISAVHDKIFAIQKALTIFNTSIIFLDADSRIFGSIPLNLKFPQGIVALKATGLMKDFKARLNKRLHVAVPEKILSMSKWNLFRYVRLIKFKSLKNKRIAKFKKRFHIIKHLAKKLRINLENTALVHEFLFTVTRENGREENFFREYKSISNYLMLHGIFRSVAYSMGLAAQKAGLSISRKPDKIFKGFEYFKDRILMETMRKGQEYDKMELYLLKERNLANKLAKRKYSTYLREKIKQVYLRIYLRTKLFLESLADIKFYYI